MSDLTRIKRVLLTGKTTVSPNVSSKNSRHCALDSRFQEDADPTSPGAVERRNGPYDSDRC